MQQSLDARERYGIASTQSIILEFESLNNDPRDVLETRFGALGVSESRRSTEEGDRVILITRFRDAVVLRQFRQEASLYAESSNERGVLPAAMRRDFFDSLQEIRYTPREQRLGPRLNAEDFPGGERNYYDVDLWYPGDDELARNLLDSVRDLCQRQGGSFHDSIRTTSLLLVKVSGARALAEALLEQDFVARVDLPPVLGEAYPRIFEPVNFPDPDLMPDENAPIACVIDSGVVAGHPLLANWIIEERDFDSGEGTPVDRNGHGTAVAGLVVYGDIARCLERNTWQPKVRICSAKILRHEPRWDDPSDGEAIFPDENRLEEIVEQSIRYFHRERGCRIFNLSFGSKYEIYDGKRQFPLAEKLDELIRELDIVVVVSSGNVAEPEIPSSAGTQDAFQKAIQEQLLDPGHRLCNPATSALAVTVGAIARSDAVAARGVMSQPALASAFAGSKANAASPFTRTGPGYEVSDTQAGIKPEFVDYGGNFAARQLTGSGLRWAKNFIFMGEPTIERDVSSRFIGARSGTSFACPHVTHSAALAMLKLEESLGRQPSANLVRSLIGSTVAMPVTNPPQAWEENERLRVMGHGRPMVDEVIAPQRNRVRLIAEDEIREDSLHIYKVTLPQQFLEARGRRGITIALAYDPPVRASRRQYLSRTMNVEALQGLTLPEVEKYRSKYLTGKVQPTLPSGAALNMRAPKTKQEWSTLQVRRIEWTFRPRIRKAVSETESTIYIVVQCHQRFPTGLDPRQSYGLTVLLWHDDPRLNLYQLIRSRVRVPGVRVPIRA